VVGVCHVTRSASKPYLFVEVREDAVDLHREHGDIIGVDSQAECPAAPARAAEIRR
jgi:hypothetical protein